MSKIINTEDLLSYFYDEPNRWYHVREIARLAQINPTTASKYLEIHSRQQIVIKKEERGHVLFRANAEHPAYRDRKIFYNIKNIKESGVIEFLEKELHYPQAIVLFGSYSKGENDQNSDIDLFILANKKKNPDVTIYEKRLKSKIQLVIKTKDEFLVLQKENKNLVNSMLNGIILKGFLEVFR